MRKWAISSAGFAGLLGIWAVSADAAVLLEGPNTTSIPGVSNFVTDGNDMTGMAVTATFADGSFETVAWQGLGGTVGQALGTGWQINVFNDTFNDFAWEVMNSRLTAPGALLGLTGLFLDGAPGLTIFDRTLPNTGTPGSAQGKDFFTNLLDDALVVATYDFEIGIGADAPIGDLWQTLAIDFTGLNNGLGALERIFLFTQDADNDIRRQIPEPAGLGLLGVGLMAAWTLRRARRQPDRPGAPRTA